MGRYGKHGIGPDCRENGRVANELCHFAPNPTRRRAYRGRQIPSRARRMADFTAKYAIIQLNCQVLQIDLEDGGRHGLSVCRSLARPVVKRILPQI